MSLYRPELEYYQATNGNSFLALWYLSKSQPAGVLEAEIDARCPTDLYIANIDVGSEYLRRGIALHLTRTAVRAVLELHTSLETCSAAIINPVAVPLMQKVFGPQKVRFFSDQQGGEAAPLSTSRAVMIAEAYAATMKAYESLNQDAPAVPGVYARVAFDFEQIASWPQLEQLDRLALR